MSPDILILGQGLAGTLLGWELERAGICFAIADPGSEAAASRVAAGIVNPITGRRLVKSAGVDTLLPIARERYRELGATLGVSLWRDLRVRRLFRDDRERRVQWEKQAGGDLAPFLGPVDEAGFWIEGAGCVDLPALLTSSRQRWQRKGWLHGERIGPAEGLDRFDRVIDCRGVGGVVEGPFEFVPWQFSKGEILEVAVEGLDFRHVINDGHWVLPMRTGVAWVGATHEPGVIDRQPTAAGREVLAAAAERLLARSFTVLDHRAGVRVNLPDKMPVVGVHPREPRLGLLNGLGAKGALLAPALARQWAGYLTRGAAFEPGFDLGRFALGR